MPHKCTRCESIFKDGAAIILNGCPKCGWNKFLYVRDDLLVPGPVVKIEDATNAGQISPEASNFIKEVDEILGIKKEITELKNRMSKFERFIEFLESKPEIKQMLENVVK